MLGYQIVSFVVYISCLYDIAEQATHICGDSFFINKWNVSVTYAGNDCQDWNFLTTSAEIDYEARCPDLEFPYNVSNHCQDPSSSGILWCYAVNSQIYIWEPCFYQRELIS